MTTSPKALLSRTLNLLLVAAFVVIAYLSTAPIGWEAVEPYPTPEADAVVALLGEHGCWTGEAPTDMQGVIPGHVVVTVDGDAKVGGSRLVGHALEQIFDGTDHGLTVHGFCR